MKQRKHMVLGGIALLATVALVFCMVVYNRGHFLSANANGHIVQIMQNLNGNVVVDSADDQKNIAKKEKIFAETKEQYENLVAWIIIPGTSIDYPVMQSEEQDYYITHNMDGEEDVYGTPFIVPTQSKDFSQLCTMIFAHDMNNGTMFGGLESYVDGNVEDLQDGILITERGTWRVDFFACSGADAMGVTVYEETLENVENPQELNQFISEYSPKSPTIQVTDNDRVVALTTLEGDTEDSETTVLYGILKTM